MKHTIDVKDEYPLRWPDGWSRTLIEHRQSQAAWKKPFAHYRESALLELERMGVKSVTISRNEVSKERLDPGVAIWFSMKVTEDFTWQVGLQLDNPAPSLDEIDSAYRRLVQKHHPDAVANGSGGDVQMFHKLSDHRKKARAWVLGENAPALDNCIPMDRYSDARQNMAGIVAFIRHLRGLERLGSPAILERMMTRTFKTALPEHKEEKRGIPVPA